MLVIGKSTNPTPFKNYAIPVEYHAWMKSVLFVKWFREQVRRFQINNNMSEH